MEHALVKLGDTLIPLIGVPKDAALEECDLCHDIFPLWEIEYNGKQYLCAKCGTDMMMQAVCRGLVHLKNVTGANKSIQ